MKKLLELPEFLQGLAAMKGIKDPTEDELMEIRKSIIITPDASMIYTDDFPVDIILNACGAVRRENIDQLYEIELNFSSWWIQKKMKELSTLEEKAELAFRYLNIINKDECEFFMKMYNDWDQEIMVSTKNIHIINTKEQKKFIDNIEKYGFYIAKPVDSNIRYETLKKIYEEFEFIQPLDAYVDIFGTKRRKLINPVIAADKFIMFLIHNNNKNFSARSTFRVNRSNLPTKDIAKRQGRSPYSHNPVRLGELAL